MSTAFEAITTRQSWHAAEEIAKYNAVEFNAEGKYVNAVGDGQFVGIAQYGAENIDDMVTVVKGTFPAISSEDLAAGDNVTIDTDNAGLFKKAGVGDAIYGKALTGVIEGNLFTLAMADVPVAE